MMTRYAVVLGMVVLCGCGWAQTAVKMGGASDGYHQYHCVHDNGGPEGKKGRVEEDHEAEAYWAEEQARKDDLARAFTSRILTDEELKQVLAYGSHIFTRPMQPYFQEDIDKRFSAAMQLQIQLRTLAAINAGAKKEVVPDTKDGSQ